MVVLKQVCYQPTYFFANKNPHQGQVRAVLVCVLISLGLVMMAALHLDSRPAQPCNCPEKEQRPPVAAASKLEAGHKLCLIVPFKDR